MKERDEKVKLLEGVSFHFASIIQALQIHIRVKQTFVLDYKRREILQQTIQKMQATIAEKDVVLVEREVRNFA